MYKGETSYVILNNFEVNNQSHFFGNDLKYEGLYKGDLTKCGHLIKKV